jgi:hypothetical protein
VPGSPRNVVISTGCITTDTNTTDQHPLWNCTGPSRYRTRSLLQCDGPPLDHLPGQSAARGLGRRHS